ncbi:D-alanyl-D-alanine carboxypeptidase [Opitutaceae bacterium EW11]|nr:D-alanyl-D-alanine carboxypeptidase [Opitutaceae bacterium EW11]
MNRIRLFLALAIASFFAASGHAASAKHRARSSDANDGGTYKGAIVIDALSGKTLFEQNADVVTPPASMTKLMTFAVLSDRLKSGQISLTTPVKIEAEDAKMGGTQVYLDPRETFPVEELIYAMMIQSANDAAHALARAAAGSSGAFVELMNAKAQEIGMTHTTFRSPHGLPPPSRNIHEGDLTTPRDFATLCRYLVLNTDVLKYTSVKKRDFGTERAKGPQHMENHNKLLGRIGGVDGLKTGYTEGAGYCLSATAERNGRRVIVVLMGSFGPGGRKDLGKSRDLHVIELIERGFAALPPAAPGVAAPAPVSSPKPSPATGSAQVPETSPISAAQPSTPTPTASAPADDLPKVSFPSLKK